MPEPERVVWWASPSRTSCWPSASAPVGVTEWYGEQPHATWPWATEALGDA